MNNTNSPKRKSISFDAFHGLLTMLAPGDGAATVEPIKGLMDSISRKKESTANTRCDILILDTYLRGSFKSEDMGRLLEHAKREASINDRKGVFKILLLDPESESGRSRARLLQINPPADAIAVAIDMLDESLNIIIAGISEWMEDHLHVPEWPKAPKARTQAKIDYVNSLTTEPSPKLSSSIELRLYSVFTESPVYIVDNFAAKGLLLSHRGASKSRWLVFVNDFWQEDDMFDIFRNNFDSIWAKSTSKIGGNASPPKFFIVWGRSIRSKQVFEEIRHVLRHWKIEHTWMMEEPGEGDLNEIFRHKANDCDGLIAVHCEDMVSKSSDPPQIEHKHASANVLLETGYFWHKVTIDRCIFIKEREVELPTDIQGRAIVDPSDTNWKQTFANIIKARWNIDFDSDEPETRQGGTESPKRPRGPNKPSGLTRPNGPKKPTKGPKKPSKSNTKNTRRK